MKKLKVWGGLVYMGERGQLRTIIASTSQAKAATAVGESLSAFRKYWSETGNQTELDVATSAPDQPFQATSSMDKDFSPATLKRPVNQRDHPMSNQIPQSNSIIQTLKKQLDEWKSELDKRTRHTVLVDKGWCVFDKYDRAFVQMPHGICLTPVSINVSRLPNNKQEPNDLRSCVSLDDITKMSKDDADRVVKYLKTEQSELSACAPFEIKGVLDFIRGECMKIESALKPLEVLEDASRDDDTIVDDGSPVAPSVSSRVIEP